MRGGGGGPGESGESGAKRRSRRFAKRKILVISPTMRGGFIARRFPTFHNFPRGIRSFNSCAAVRLERGRFRAGFRETPECPPLDQSRLGIAPNPRRFFFPGPRRAFARVETRRTRGRVARHTPPSEDASARETARATLGARSIKREFAGTRSRDPARRREAPRRLARCVARSGERKEQPSSSHLVGRARTSVGGVRARALPRARRALTHPAPARALPRVSQVPRASSVRDARRPRVRGFGARRARRELVPRLSLGARRAGAPARRGRVPAPPSPRAPRVATSPDACARVPRETRRRRRRRGRGLHRGPGRPRARPSTATARTRTTLPIASTSSSSPLASDPRAATAGDGHVRARLGPELEHRPRPRRRSRGACPGGRGVRAAEEAPRARHRGEGVAPGGARGQDGEDHRVRLRRGGLQGALRGASRTPSATSSANTSRCTSSARAPRGTRTRSSSCAWATTTTRRTTRTRRRRTKTRRRLGGRRTPPPPPPPRGPRLDAARPKGFGAPIPRSKRHTIDIDEVDQIIRAFAEDLEDEADSDSDDDSDDDFDDESFDEDEADLAEEAWRLLRGAAKEGPGPLHCARGMSRGGGGGSRTISGARSRANRGASSRRRS